MQQCTNTKFAVYIYTHHLLEPNATIKLHVSIVKAMQLNLIVFRYNQRDLY